MSYYDRPPEVNGYSIEGLDRNEVAEWRMFVLALGDKRGETSARDEYSILYLADNLFLTANQVLFRVFLDYPAGTKDVTCENGGWFSYIRSIHPVILERFKQWREEKQEEKRKLEELNSQWIPVNPRFPARK